MLCCVILECAESPLLVNVSALPDARSARSERGRGVLRAFGKAVSTWPPVGAVDAGPMQIQLREGVGLRCAETVLSGATQDAARPESWLGGKSIAQAVVEGAGRKNLFGRQTEKWLAHRSAQSFRVGESASCGSSNRWWRTKLEFCSGESLDDSHRSTAFGAPPRGWVISAGSMWFGLRLWCGAE